MSNDEPLEAEIIEAEVTKASKKRATKISSNLKAEIHRLQLEHEQELNQVKREADVLRQDNFKLRNRLENLSENFCDVSLSTQKLQKLLKQLKNKKFELEKQLSQAEWKASILYQNAAKAIEAKNRDLAIKEIMREIIQRNLVKVLKSQLEQQNQILETLQSNLQVLEKFIKKM